VSAWITRSVRVRLHKERDNLSVNELLKARLRAAVLREYDSYCQRAGYGPCGAVAVALERLGFGEEASVFAVSAEERDDCEDLEEVFDAMPKGRVCLTHYVVVGSQDKILDVALPRDFKLAGYAQLNVEPLADLFYGEEDYRFWYDILSEALKERKAA